MLHYACQVWGTQVMKKGSEFDSPLQTAHMCFLKGVLGAKRTTPSWAVLRNCGQEPLQLYWFRPAANFFLTLYFAGTVACFRRLCMHIASYKKCWTVEFIEACEGPCASDRYADCV